jgi:hypothetical protein
LCSMSGYSSRLRTSNGDVWQVGKHIADYPA